MTVAERIGRSSVSLTPTERRVAERVVEDPSAVAFGTVAALASAAEASGPTVLRLAAKLGYDGFGGLQAAVRDELADSLRPAAERIRSTGSARPLARALAVEAANVRTTLEGVDPARFDEVVRLLADRRRQVRVLSGEATAGVADLLRAGLDLLRPGIGALVGPDVAVARGVAELAAGDVVVAVDLRRYERWVLDAAAAAVGRGAVLVAVTDGPLSPLAASAAHTFVVAADGVGPFDSHVGTLALGNALAAGVAGRLRRSATARLDAVEAATSPHLVP